MSWDELDEDEQWGRISEAGVRWLKENDPGRAMDLKRSRTRLVRVTSELGDSYECQVKDGAFVHIPQEFITIQE